MTVELVPARPASCVVTVHGDEDLAVTARLRSRLEEALASRPQRVVVDLEGCAHLDATALGVLLEVHRTARRQGRELVLRGLAPRVERLLALTGLAGVFAVETVVG